MFHEVLEAVEKPPAREQTDNKLARPSMWLLVEQWAAMRKQGTLDKYEARRLGWKIALSLKEDCKDSRQGKRAWPSSAN